MTKFGNSINLILTISTKRSPVTVTQLYSVPVEEIYKQPQDVNHIFIHEIER